MPNVYVRKAGYDLDTLRPVVFELLAAMDGGSIGTGTRVLLKPNLLAPATPEQAITTHPLVVRCAAEYALQQGAKVQVSDSNAVGSFQKTLQRSGLADALRDLPVSVSEFTESVKVSTEGRFLAIELAKDALEADVIINLPKLKTHQQMGMTLAVKNLFGCVVGMRKPEWHYRVGEDKELFGELLATIFRQIRPRINLLDAVLAMEGHGPGTGGTPRHIGVLMGSTDAVALDRAACAMVGMVPDTLYTTMAAGRMGLPGEYEIDGELPEVEGFDIPDTKDLLFGGGLLKNFLRGHIASRPRNIESACRYCNECVNICPAGAITNPTGRHLHFDYEACIRCYCCMEVCPHKAMEKHDTWVKKLANFVYHSSR